MLWSDPPFRIPRWGTVTLFSDELFVEHAVGFQESHIYIYIYIYILCIYTYIYIYIERERDCNNANRSAGHWQRPRARVIFIIHFRSVQRNGPRPSGLRNYKGIIRPLCENKGVMEINYLYRLYSMTLSGRVE